MRDSSGLTNVCDAEKLMVSLRDGRKLIGVLRSWDQFGRASTPAWRFAKTDIRGACMRC